MVELREVIVIVLVLECVLGKTIWPFNIQTWNISNSIANFKLLKFTQAPIQIKVYTGRRIAKDSLRMAYLHEDTLAIVERGDKDTILNCEIAEIM